MSMVKMTLKSIVTASTALSVACSASDEKKDMIESNDPRFEIFQLSNSAGDGSYSNPHGKVQHQP